MLKIVQVPNKVLITPTQKVVNFDSKLKKLIADMEETLIAQVDPQGVGLAATQVGVNKAIFIMKPKPTGPTTVCINPEILQIEEPSTSSTKKSKKKQSGALEGCLSIPRIWSPLRRPKKVLLKYQTEAGETKEEWFVGFKAIIVQHEVDHLNGILFTKRALEQNSSLYEEREGELLKIKSI
ncbi:peptide deformylase [Candidatus Roizmanbacteria bacterium]|nr:peptide deformylase [Candidatus Roizmanbacteria bacterium]